MTTPLKVVITGAHGFLARIIAKQLSSAGYEVLGWTRISSASQASGSGFSKILPVNYQAEDLSEYCKGAHAVIHLAGLAHAKIKHDPAVVYKQAIYDLTQKVWAAAKAENVPYFIYASSVKVYGENSRQGILTEDSPCDPQSFYGKYKLLTEDALFEDARRMVSPKLFVLRFPPIYGFGSKGILRWLFKFSQWRVPSPVIGMKFQRSMVSGHNIGILLENILASKIDAGVYLPVDGPPQGIEEIYLEIWRQTHGERPSFFYLSLSRILGRVLWPLIRTKSFAQNFSCSSKHLSVYKQINFLTQAKAIKDVVEEMQEVKSLKS